VKSPVRIHCGWKHGRGGGTSCICHLGPPSFNRYVYVCRGARGVLSPGTGRVKGFVAEQSLANSIHPRAFPLESTGPDPAITGRPGSTNLN